MLVGGVELFHVTAAREHNIELCHDQHDKQDNTNYEGDEAVTGRLVLHVVDGQLVADTLHAVRQGNVVHRVIDGVCLALGFESLLPATCLLVDLGDGIVALVAKLFPGQCHGLVSLTLRGEVIHFQRSSVDGRLAFLHTFLIRLVAFEELVHLAGGIIADGTSCVDVEHALGGIFLGYLLGSV